MSDINHVLERLVTDPGFRQQLREDPKQALEGYDLDDAAREMLAAQISDSKGGARPVEQRTSKSALAGLLGAGLGESGVMPYDDSHQIEMDAHVGKAPPEGPTDLTADQPEEPAVDMFLKLEGIEGEPADIPPQESLSLNYSELKGEGDGLSNTTMVSESEPRSSADQTSPVESEDNWSEAVAPEGDHLASESADTGSPVDPSQGDPQVGEVTPRGWDPTLKRGVTQDSQLEGEPDQPVIIGSVPNPDDDAQASSGSGAGKVSMQDISFAKFTDRATPLTDSDGEDLIGYELSHDAQQLESDQAFVSRLAEDGEDMEGKAQGNVEYSWKIEEGVKVAPPIGEELAGSGSPDDDVVAVSGAGGEEAEQPIVLGRMYNDESPTHQAGEAESSSDGESVQATSEDEEVPSGGVNVLFGDGSVRDEPEADAGDLVAEREASEGIEGTDVSTGYTSEPGDIGDDLPDDPPDS